MSQKKVEKYKQEKASRQKNMKREKILRRLEFAVIGIVLAGVLVWFCFAVYQNSKVKALENADTVTTPMDVTAVDEYLNGLTAASSSAE